MVPELHQFGVPFAPDKGSGGDSSGLSEAEHPHRLEQGIVVSQIRAIQKDTIARTYFELVELGTTGLLSALELSEIVPLVPENSNPFSAEGEEELHEQWWEEHPVEGEEFSISLQRRCKVLNTLSLGAALRRITDGQLYHFLETPHTTIPEIMAAYLQ